MSNLAIQNVSLNDISVESYGEYSSDNYGAHSLCFTVGNIDFYFSYKTLVAIRGNGIFACIRNYWGPTTGKHLNWIQRDKSKRLSQEDFEKTVEEVLKG